MICYYRNSISWGANRMEFKDPIEIKAKLKTKWEKTKLVSHFGRAKKKREGEERRREEVEEEEDEKERYGFLLFYMEYLYGWL